MLELGLGTWWDNRHTNHRLPLQKALFILSLCPVQYRILLLAEVIVRLRDVKTPSLKIPFLMQFLPSICSLLSKTTWLWTAQHGFSQSWFFCWGKKLYTKCFRFFKSVTETKECVEISARVLKMCIIPPWKTWFLCVKMLFRNRSWVPCTPGVTVDGSRRFGSAGNTHQNCSA